MSAILIVLSFANLLLLLLLSLRIRSYYRSVDRDVNIIEYYGDTIQRIWQGKIGMEEMICFVHYIVMHLVVPLIGLGFTLRTDINFLAILAAIFASMQIIQRIYPGVVVEADDEESSTNDSSRA